MKWEELTAPDFAQAVKDTGVCLLPFGIVEKHFDHLPLGTDFLNVSKMCSLAAEIEPAVVFPPYYFGQIEGARRFPGTVAIDPILSVKLLINVCDEIARNGFKKIIIWNGHGGNRQLIQYVGQAHMSKRKDYMLYIPEYLYGISDEERRKRWKAVLDTDWGGHGGEVETSISLANHEHLVKMDALKGRYARPLNRLSHLPPGRPSGYWYANYPDHYAGDGNAGTREKGEKLRDLAVESLVEYIRAVKNDTVAATLLNEFYDRCDELATEQ